ncbi:MAG: flavin reductase family protein [Litorivicinaceae bacterium]
MFVDIESIRDQLPFDPFKAIVAPRPIGWISTISASGVANLATSSFFNALSSDPHRIGFSSSGWKDTVSNCDATGEFVFNLVTQTLLTSMSQTSAAIPPEESEFAFCGLESVPSYRVSAPRVAQSPAALECRVVEIRQLQGLDGVPCQSWFTIGEVIGIYLDPAFITEAGRFDTAKAAIPTRCGYQDYMEAGDLFELPRP